MGRLGKAQGSVRIKFEILKNRWQVVNKFDGDNHKKLVRFYPVIHPPAEISKGKHDILIVPGGGKEFSAKRCSKRTLWLHAILNKPAGRNVVGVVGVTNNHDPVYMHPVRDLVEGSGSYCLNHPWRKIACARLQTGSPFIAKKATCR